MEENNNNQQNNDAIVQDLHNRIQELENNWKRALADYKNLEKRNAEEKLAGIIFANEVLIQAILPSIDNLEMTEKHCDDMGLKITLKELKQTLANHGVKEIEALNKDFDPSIMEAIDVTEGEKNKVMEILTKGYLLNDRLIRPVRVKVGSGEVSGKVSATEPTKEI